MWNYVVGNYLKGETPPPFDLLYWNGDSTNLPGPMYCWYLRHTYLQNELKVPGRLTVCGEKVDLGSIKAPVFVYASREDHIVPWQAAYASTPLVKGEGRGQGNKFVLGASGHIAGVINPPAKGKRSHWVNDKLPATRRGLVRTAPPEHPAAGGPIGAAGSSRWPASRWPRPRRRATGSSRPSSRRRAATSRPRPEPMRATTLKPGALDANPD